jgi:hypothetical protein
LVSVFPTSEKFDSDLEMDARSHKIGVHPCPPMPTQNPWGWVGMGMGMGMGTQRRALANNLLGHQYKLNLVVNQYVLYVDSNLIIQILMTTICLRLSHFDTFSLEYQKVSIKSSRDI